MNFFRWSVGFEDQDIDRCGEAVPVISEARSVWREAKRYRGLDRANNDSTIPNGVYISVFGGLRLSYQASTKRKGAGEGKKGEQGFVFIDIPERSSARFAKIYFRALIM